MATPTTLPHVRQRTFPLALQQGAAWRRAEFVHRLLLLSALPPDAAAPSPQRRPRAGDRGPEQRPRDDLAVFNASPKGD